ncbi:collagen alpha-2(I) chain-like [Homarus americanus]|uniref:collagen alpha-2(I) chain-like n=1 Tax=Homarus americanus TaxID=6706 RepID=UPI001C44EEB9|nr:collagen alpha-2(I) chain-like [Homarus americanus]
MLLPSLWQRPQGPNQGLWRPQRPPQGRWGHKGLSQERQCPQGSFQRWWCPPSGDGSSRGLTGMVAPPGAILRGGSSPRALSASAGPPGALPGGCGAAASSRRGDGTPRSHPRIYGSFRVPPKSAGASRALPRVAAPSGALVRSGGNPWGPGRGGGSFRDPSWGGGGTPRGGSVTARTAKGGKAPKGPARGCGTLRCLTGAAATPGALRSLAVLPRALPGVAKTPGDLLEAPSNQEPYSFLATPGPARACGASETSGAVGAQGLPRVAVPPGVLPEVVPLSGNGSSRGSHRNDGASRGHPAGLPPGTSQLQQVLQGLPGVAPCELSQGWRHSQGPSQVYGSRGPSHECQRLQGPFTGGCTFRGPCWEWGRPLGPWKGRGSWRPLMGRRALQETVASRPDCQRRQSPKGPCQAVHLRYLQAVAPQGNAGREAPWGFSLAVVPQASEGAKITAHKGPAEVAHPGALPFDLPGEAPKGLLGATGAPRVASQGSRCSQGPGPSLGSNGFPGTLNDLGTPGGPAKLSTAASAPWLSCCAGAPRAIQGLGFLGFLLRVVASTALQGGCAFRNLGSTGLIFYPRAPPRGGGDPMGTLRAPPSQEPYSFLVAHPGGPPVRPARWKTPGALLGGQAAPSGLQRQCSQGPCQRAVAHPKVSMVGWRPTWAWSSAGGFSQAAAPPEGSPRGPPDAEALGNLPKRQHPRLPPSLWQRPQGPPGAIAPQRPSPGAVGEPQGGLRGSSVTAQTAKGGRAPKGLPMCASGVYRGWERLTAITRQQHPQKGSPWFGSDSTGLWVLEPWGPSRRPSKGL